MHLNAAEGKNGSGSEIWREKSLVSVTIQKTVESTMEVVACRVWHATNWPLDQRQTSLNPLL